jgi:ATP-dependent phosphofructokinase / diphosphate-dependent phosphofructokinase
MGYPIQAIHVPKTVDNDLPITDNCPGFGSVAKYVAVSTREASFDVASMAKTSTKVFVLEVMGRHAGWIAAAGGMAADETIDLPIVILFPEVPFDRERFLKVEGMVKRYGYCSVVVSEGVQDADGKFLSDQGLRDAFGHAQLGGVAPVIANMSSRTSATSTTGRGRLPAARGAPHRLEDRRQQAYAVGKAAVKMALAGENAVMPHQARIHKPYKWRIEAPLDKVANVEKKMPRSFISRDGFGITAKCREYLAPLIQGEDYPPYRNGLPSYVRPKNVQVKKKLKPFQV